MSRIREARQNPTRLASGELSGGGSSGVILRHLGLSSAFQVLTVQPATLQTSCVLQWPLGTEAEVGWAGWGAGGPGRGTLRTLLLSNGS